MSAPWKTILLVVGVSRWKTILLVVGVSSCVSAVTASILFRRTHESIRASVQAARAARAAHEAKVSRLASIEVLTAEPDPAVVTDADARERIKATGKPWKIKHTASGIVMLLVPPGEFTMGEGDDARRQVIPKAFYLSKNEVSNAEWEALTGTRPLSGDDAAQPVQGASWISIHNDFLLRSRDFFRLPSEAEWEYACKAGKPTREPAGDGITDAHVRHATPIACGTLPANSWGFHDMEGSVSEWMEDEYAQYPEVGSAMAAPRAAEGGARVLRSGGWNRGTDKCRAARDPSCGMMLGPEVDEFSFPGFRVARDAE